MKDPMNMDNKVRIDYGSEGWAGQWGERRNNWNCNSINNET